MTVTTDVKRMGDAIVAQGKATLADARKPLFAWIGANRVVLARTRELPDAVQAQVRQLPAKLGELPTVAKTLPRVLPADAVTSSAKQLAVRAVSLQRQAGTVASTVAGTVAGTLAERVAVGYAGLVGRGQEVADTAVANPAAQQAKKSAARAGKQSKAAATSARKAASSAATAARDTAQKTTS